jgi:hypothetical protein
MAKKNESEFWELYNHPQWQKKKSAIMTRDGFRCRECGNDKETLHVHHGYYNRGKKPWEYPDDSLRTLCKTCHDKVAETRQELLHLISNLSVGTTRRIIGYVLGISERTEEALTNKNLEKGWACVCCVEEAHGFADATAMTGEDRAEFVRLQRQADDGG